MHDLSSLSRYRCIGGCLTLGGVDTPEIALANLLAGISHRQPQEKKVVINGDSLENIIAVPAVPMEIDDESARQFVLLEDLIAKLKNLETPEGKRGLILSGRLSTQLSNAIENQFNGVFETIQVAPMVSASLDALAETCEHQEIDHWLWISVHAGCSARAIAALRGNIATNLTSECPAPADAAVGIWLSAQPGKRSHVGREIELFADDPLAGKTDALAKLLVHTPNIERSVLVHNLPASAKGSIELYRLEQALDEKRPEYEDVSWANNIPPRFNLSTVFGDTGVCSLPLLMLFQHYWCSDEPVKIMAAESQWRMSWLIE